MPDLATLAESQRIAPRALLQLDVDAARRTPSGGARLLRCTATTYEPHLQRADVRFLYDKFVADDDVDRFVSDFPSHVYFPSEIELLSVPPRASRSCSSTATTGSCRSAAPRLTSSPWRAAQPPEAAIARRVCDARDRAEPAAILGAQATRHLALAQRRQFLSAQSFSRSFLPSAASPSNSATISS